MFQEFRPGYDDDRDKGDFVMDTCPKCGKTMLPGCSVPGCKGPIEVYSRIVGYMRPVSYWNPGKQQEFADRKTFVLNKGDHEEHE